MNSVHKTVRTGCCVAITAAVCLFLWRLNTKLPNLSGAQSTVSSVQKIAIDLGAVVASERDAETKRDIEFYKSIAAAKEVIIRLDTSLTGHDGLIPVTKDAVLTITNDVNSVTTNTNAVLSAGTVLLNTGNRRIADPRIDDIVMHFDMMSLHLEGMTASSDLAFAHGNHIISYYDERLTSPKGFTKTFFTGIKDWIVEPG